MSISSRSSNRGVSDTLPAESSDLDRLFGRDFSSKGWVVDLARLYSSGSEDDETYMNDDDLDPAMIWVMGGRRR